MTKFFCTFLLSAVLAMPAAAKLKMDAQSLQIAQAYQLAKANPSAVIAVPSEMPFSLEAASRGSVQSGAVIILADGATAADVESYGLVVEHVADDVVVANGSIDDILELAQSDVVVSVNFPKQLSVETVTVRADIGQDLVISGEGDRPGYDGTDVICALFDCGFDPNHINFYDKAFENHRVKALYHYTGSGGTCTEYKTAEAITGFTTDDESNTHGTHTLGCMAGGMNLKGNGKIGSVPTGTTAVFNSTETGVNCLASKRNEYCGMAPGADIVISCGTLYDANIIAGVGKMANYILDSGKPGVINLSIGSVYGSHDGTDAMGKALNKYGKQVPICVSAGNDGDNDISITKTFTASDNKIQTVFKSSSSHSGIFQAYSNSDKEFDVKFIIFDASTNTIYWEYDVTEDVVMATENYNASTYKHAAKFEEAFSTSFLNATFDSTNNGNGRYNLNLSYKIVFNTTTNADCNLKFGIVITGENGQRVDCTNSVVSGSCKMSSMDQAGWDDATPDFSINGMACADNVIAVGAYTTHNKVPILKPAYVRSSAFTVGEVCYFSSYGTRYDGRVLPDVLAPGAMVVSSVSSYSTCSDGEWDNSSYVSDFTWNDRHYMWGQMSGTSQASPVMAGCVATMLQANPLLTPAEIKEIIHTAAVVDDGCTTSDSNRPAVGKIKSNIAIQEVMKTLGVADIRVEQSQLSLSREGNSYIAFVPGAAKVDVRLYNMTGTMLSHVSAQGDQATISVADLAPGIYLINVNGVESRRVLVK